MKLFRRIDDKKERFPLSARLWIISLSLVIAALVTERAVDFRQEARLVMAQEKLAEEVLRFHILANSDSEEDQALKMEVKEAVLDWMEGAAPDEMDVTETKLWLKQHSDELEELCENEIRKRGYDYPVSAAVTTCYFPEKSYEDMTFPEGNYEALRIEIGAAEGHNWWCVLYPNLCFAKAVRVVVPEEKETETGQEQMLTEEAYDLSGRDADVRIKSYFLERFTGE